MLTGLFELEKMQQIRSEQSVEDIIRQRSLSIFFSRCRGFET